FPGSAEGHLVECLADSGSLLIGKRLGLQILFDKRMSRQRRYEIGGGHRQVVCDDRCWVVRALYVRIGGSIRRVARPPARGASTGGLCPRVCLRSLLPILTAQPLLIAWIALKFGRDMSIHPPLQVGRRRRRAPCTRRGTR